MDAEPLSTTLAERNPSSGDSLISTNVPDDLVNEQTWPTEDEMRTHEINSEDPKLPEAVSGTTPKSVKRVPKGTSEYQAAWILDDDEEDESVSGDEMDDEEEEEDAILDEEKEPSQLYHEDDNEEMEDLETDAGNNKKKVEFDDLDEEEEAQQ